MLRLLALPLFIMSGLPNKPPDCEKPAETIVQQAVELNQELCCCQTIRVFHSGTVAQFGLNKTALAPQGDKRNKPGIPKVKSDNIRSWELTGTHLPKKPCGEVNNQTEELVSPLIVNLSF